MKKKICMIIPSFSAKGGITSVASGYRNSQLEDDFDIKYIETYCDGNIFLKVLFALKAYIVYIGYLFFWHPSIIHIHSSFGGSFYRKVPFVILGKWFKIPIINHIHGADFNIFYLNAPTIKKRLINNIYNKCFKLIALSEEWKENLKKIVDENKIVVIENYSILNKDAIQERRYKKNNYNVLFLGFVCKRKGCYDIPSIVEKVVREIPDAKFVLAGSGDIEQIKAITPVTIRNNITYPGWVRDNEKDKLLREADLFFLPSYNEGMPMAILDAMGYGLPIVSSTVGGITKIVHNGENGYVCKAGNVDDFARAIIKLLTDDKALKNFGQSSVTIIANGYSLEEHINRIEKLYRSVKV